LDELAPFLHFVSKVPWKLNLMGLSHESTHVQI
jgi:hypothetical protein